MFALLQKEIGSFLSSLTGYIVITVFLLINGLFLWVFQGEFNILDLGYANINGLFMIAPFVFLFLIPAITMRSFSEEKRTGTIELLLTKPLTELEVVLAKFFAGFILVVFSLLPTLVYFFSVYHLGLQKGNLDTGGMWGSYIGLLFLGGSFVSIGMFASTLTDNQIVSFIVAVFFCGFFYIGFDFIYSFDLFGNFDLLIKSLGINDHYVSMSRGVLDTRDMIYFLGIIALFILLSRYSIERRKW
jgi:ABC-2 type transport system permease protein